MVIQNYYGKQFQTFVTFHEWLKIEYDLVIDDLDSEDWAKYTKLWQIKVLDKV